MRGTKAAGAIVACLVAAIIGGACSSSGSSNGDKAAFCKTNADISAKLSNVTSEAEVIDAFKSVESQFDSYVKNAPSEVKADAQKQVDAARKAIKDNNASQFQSDQDLQKASDHVDTFCGQKSSSSPSSSSSSSSSTSASSTSSSSGSESAAACTLFDLESLNSATNLTWKVVDSSQPNSCVVQADNGNTVSMNLATTGGQGAQALEGGKTACDSGTVQDVAIADGGFVCKSSGVNTAVAAFNGSQKLVAVAAITFNQATDSDIQAALVALLKTFQAS
jgi:hypothetical protein